MHRSRGGVTDVDGGLPRGRAPGVGVAHEAVRRQQGLAHGGPGLVQVLLRRTARRGIRLDGGREAGVVPEDAVLLGGLVGARAVQLRGPVRREGHEAGAGVEGLHEGGQEVPDRRARRREHPHGAARGQGEPVGEEARRALVHPHVQPDPALPFEVGQRVHEGRGAGAGADHRVPHPGVGQGGGDGARHGEGVGGSHGGPQSRRAEPDGPGPCRPRTAGAARSPDAARPPRRCAVAASSGGTRPAPMLRVRPRPRGDHSPHRVTSWGRCPARGRRRSCRGRCCPCPCCPSPCRSPCPRRCCRTR